MHLSPGKELLTGLGDYMIGNDNDWLLTKKKAAAENHWFVPEFIDLATGNIATNFLQPQQLEKLINKYQIPENNYHPRKVGIVMAGNIPLVGFHDLICIFLTGHHAMIKPSSKDEVLVKHLVERMISMNPEAEKYFTISPMIPNCDAYIATGSNNSSRYFEYYFGKYPSIIRRNRTSVAILTGKETKEELEKLADDVYQYFGLGCRNVTKIFVPAGYDFLPLLEAFKKYDYLSNHHKYKNNYDYNLALHILNNRYYMTNGSIILVEDQSPYSPISQLHYEFYTDVQEVRKRLRDSAEIQCITGIEDVHFGLAQCPQITDYADNVDTMEFLMSL